MALVLSGSNGISVGTNYGIVQDASGRVRLPYLPSFKVHVTGTPAIANGTQLPFNVATYNNGNHYTLSTTGANSFFTAPIQGTYVFGGMVRSDGGFVYLHLQTNLNGVLNNNNGELPGLISTYPSTGFTSITFSYARYMYPGDYIQFLLNNPTNGTNTINGQTHMFGYFAG